MGIVQCFNFKPIVKFGAVVMLCCFTFFLQSATAQAVKAVTPEDDLQAAIDELEPGDTLILKNGIYRQPLELRNVHGTEAQPITIRAEHDGNVTIDGELKRRAIFIKNSSYIRLSGIFARDGWSEWDKNAVFIDNSHHIFLHRVTAYRAETLDRNQFHFKIGEGSHHVLLEDIAGYGSARKIFNADANTHHIIVRRFFSRWDSFDRTVDPDPNVWIVAAGFYGGERVGHHNVFENVMSFQGKNPNLPSHDIGAGGGDWHKVLGSVSLNSNADPFYFSGCSNCLFQDNVAVTPTGKRGFVSSLSRMPYLAPAENNVVLNFTWISNEAQSTGVTLGRSEADGDTLDIKNSFFQGTESSTAFALSGDQSQGELTHSYNLFYGFDPLNLYRDFHLQERLGYTDKSTDEIMEEQTENLLSEDPFGALLATYGNGAYLMASRTALAGQGEAGVNVGAEVLFQYESKWDPEDEEAPVLTTLTDEPLWPWPMEERICAETARIGDGTHGTSVTYEAHTIEYDYDGDGEPEPYHCSGGVWRTLAGVYAIPAPEDCVVPPFNYALSPLITAPSHWDECTLQELGESF